MIIGGLSYPSTNHGILSTSGMQNVRNDKMINKWHDIISDARITNPSHSHRKPSQPDILNRPASYRKNQFQSSLPTHQC